MRRFRLIVGKIFILLAVLLSIGWYVVPAYADSDSSQPSDAVLIRQRMQEVIDFIDSPDYKNKASWEESTVLVYKLSKRRMSSEIEFFKLSQLHKSLGLRRSTVLAIALRGEALKLTWDQCRAFVNRVSVSDFKVDREVREVARRLAAVPKQRIIEKLRQKAVEKLRQKVDEKLRQKVDISEIDQPGKQLKLTSPVADIQYNTYFGYLHAHSNLSDGDGSPYEAYTFARNYGELDFFALTDHGEELDLWPWEHKWESLVDAAHATYQPGSYVTLWGFEWTSPVFGHINILNTSDYTNSLFDYSLEEIYEWIIDRPESFARYNHPGDYDDFSQEFLHLTLYADVEPQMVGIETWNENDSFETFYYNGGWFSDYSFLDEGNQQGWYLGALGGQDNHNKDWGIRNDFRTAVMAEELTRDSIIDAYRNRRFYATEDKDLYLDFRCEGYPMGSKLSGVPRQFEVSAFDGSGDTFLDVLLYRNGDLIESQLVYGNNIYVSFNDYSPIGDDYYYVIVRQSDDSNNDARNDEAISSPIWISGIMTHEPEIDDKMDDFSKMYDYSSNLKLGKGYPESFNFDPSRLRRTTATREWVIYNTDADISSYKMITYFDPYRPIIGFAISASSDGINFTHLTKQVVNTGGNWIRLEFLSQQIPTGMRFLKIEFKNTNEAYSPQIGRVSIFTE